MAKIQNVFSKLAMINFTNMISYHRVTNDAELHEILQLQRLNIAQVLTSSEIEKEGFVTVQHNFDILKKMNSVCAHCIAKVNDNVVGYALCMDKRFKNDIEVLRSMFKEIDNSLVHQPKKYTNYIAMGQICINKDYRKKGIFRGLYNFMKEELKNEFNCVITEVDTKNVRSSNAHKSAGFKLLKTYFSDDKTWELILLEF